MMAEADNINDVKLMFPEIRYMFEKYSMLLKQRKVPLNELAFTKRTSKAFDEYEDRNTVENNALSNLREEGKSLRAGEILKYVITDYYLKGSKNRSMPMELANSQTKYDVKRYCEVLEEVTNTVTEPFGLSIKNQSMIPL
jgi:DNA polymerase-2